MKLTEREKAYHDGYEQGRFDEYAERMGYDQAEKVKAKIDKQKNCPYCHVPYKPFISTGIETDLDLGSGNGPVYEVISNVLGKGPIMETTLGIINILKVPNCPFCKRPLNEEEE